MSAVLAVETCHRTAKVDRQAKVPITQGLLRLKAGPARKVYWSNMELRWQVASSRSASSCLRSRE